MQLHTKYRPTDLVEIYGQDKTVNSIEKVLAKKTSQVFLFHGPAGCGKTSIARIIANMVGCTKANLMEIDAATNTGIDDMRNVSQSLRYAPIGGSPTKVLIVDECHRLSAAAWASLLKIIEEPPSYVYWIFCTTELSKVPQTIKTRCTSYKIERVRQKDLLHLVAFVVDAERFDVPKEIQKVIVETADGSPRQALVNLGICTHVRDVSEAKALLSGIDEDTQIIDLCRLLTKGVSWSTLIKCVEELDGTNPETIRILITRYFSKVVISAKNDRNAVQALKVLNAFSTPCNQTDGMAPILLALGEVRFG